MKKLLMFLLFLGVFSLKGMPNLEKRSKDFFPGIQDFPLALGAIPYPFASLADPKDLVKIYKKGTRDLEEHHKQNLLKQLPTNCHEALALASLLLHKTKLLNDLIDCDLVRPETLVCYESTQSNLFDFAINRIINEEGAKCFPAGELDCIVSKIPSTQNYAFKKLQNLELLLKRWDAIEALSDLQLSKALTKALNKEQYAVAWLLIKYGATKCYHNPVPYLALLEYTSERLENLSKYPIFRDPHKKEMLCSQIFSIQTLAEQEWGKKCLIIRKAALLAMQQKHFLPQELLFIIDIYRGTHFELYPIY